MAMVGVWMFRLPAVNLPVRPKDRFARRKTQTSLELFKTTVYVNEQGTFSSGTTTCYARRGQKND